MSKFGRYRPLQHAGFALMVVGFGVLTLLGRHPSTGDWVGLQILVAIGGGVAIPVLLPAVQASLTDEDIALSTSTWSFIRSFGLIWGSTIPIAVFNNGFNEHLNVISDPAVAAQLTNGQAYQRATAQYIDSIKDLVTRGQVQSVYLDAIRNVWWVSLGFSALAFLLVFIEKEVLLRTEVHSKYGQAEKEQSAHDAEEAAEAR